jgi:hypothetical protein
VEIETVYSRRIAFLATVALVLTTGCKPKEKGLSSMVSMGDPTVASQLASGFHGVEQGNTRWTMKKFSVVLKPPVASDQKGAMLRFQMYISPDQISRLGPITLSAEANGQQIEPQTFTKDGMNIYSRPVPAEALAGPSVKVNFSLDKARDPDGSDGRQLGVIAIVIGLQTR